MKNVLFNTMFVVFSMISIENYASEMVPAEIVEVKNVFKNNLFKNENLSQVLSQLTREIHEDFITLVDDVWDFFYKMQRYCIDHLKNNLLFEKYKQFKQNKMHGTISFSLDDKNLIKPDLSDKRMSGAGGTHEALMPFYETLTQQEQMEFDALLKDLDQFFEGLRLEYEQMLDTHLPLEAALKDVLEKTHRTLCIECGLEYPFPMLSYYID